MKNSENVFFALLGGVVLGVGIGMLLAPDKGENTREKIKEGLDKSKESLLKEYDEIVSKIKDKTTEASDTLEQVIDELADKGEKKRDEIIAMLEKKLEALKNA